MPKRAIPDALPRLDPSCYRADAAVLWTFTTRDRAKGWLNERLHFQFRELLFHAAAREGLLCPAYTLMPDHLHFTWVGLKKESDQRNGIAFLRTHLAKLIAPARFQPQAHDHVFTHEERTQNAFARSCDYIFLNPVRAGLVKEAELWSYTGCVIAGYAGVSPFVENYWSWFWKIFHGHREQACDQHVIVRTRYRSLRKELFNRDPLAQSPLTTDASL